MPPKPASSSSSYETSSGEEEEEDKVVPPPKPKPAAPKPQSSGSDDEEESSDGEEEEGSTPPPPPKPAPAPAPAASESGSSESESGSPAPAPAAKPRASKPPPPSPTKPSPATPAAATPEKKKRKAPATPAATPSAGAPKKFQRIWTDEDELAILQGMLDYNTKTGILSPSTPEMEAFRRFIQKSLRVEATTYQLSEKVRRMKKKYLTAREKNASPSFTKPHDAAVYELSQKVWGSGDGDGVNGSRAKKRRTSMNKSEKLEKSEKAEKSEKVEKSEKAEKSEKVEKDDEEEDNVVEDEKVSEGVRKGRYLYFRDAVLRLGDCIGRGFLEKDAMGMIDEAKATELNRKYKILKVQQMKSYMREMELNKEGMKVVIEALDKQA